LKQYRLPTPRTFADFHQESTICTHFVRVTVSIGKGKIPACFIVVLGTDFIHGNKIDVLNSRDVLAIGSVEIPIYVHSPLQKPAIPHMFVW